MQQAGSHRREWVQVDNRSVGTAAARFVSESQDDCVAVRRAHMHTVYVYAHMHSFT